MDENQTGYQIDGFVFQNEELFQKARQEMERIKSVRGKMNKGNPQSVLQIYNKILEQQLLETPVGIGYLRELQEYLYTMPSISKEEILPIPVEEIIQQEFVPKKEKYVNEQPQKEQVKNEPSGKLRLSLAGNIVLLLLVIAMFVITLSSSHPNILNYEETLLNKYASWEESLSAREREVQKKELELGIEP